MGRKHGFVFLMVISILCTSVVVEANSSSVAVTMPEFAVTVNGHLIENAYNQYPLLLYKGTVYMPLTYDNCKFIGIQTGWAEERYLRETSYFYIARDNITSNIYNQYKTTIPNRKKFTATKLPYRGVAVNTHDKSMYRDNTRETYPLLNFRDMLYFPLNWDYAVEQFGWEYSFDNQSGLRVDSTDPIRPITDVSLVGGSGAGHYSTVSYVYNEEGYAGYPPFTLDNHFNFVFKKKGMPEKIFSLEDQLKDADYYFNSKRAKYGAFDSLNQEDDMQPALNGSILTLRCGRYTLENQKEKLDEIIMEIDLDAEKIIKIEPYMQSIK